MRSTSEQVIKQPKYISFYNYCYVLHETLHIEEIKYENLFRGNCLR